MYVRAFGFSLRIKRFVHPMKVIVYLNSASLDSSNTETLQSNGSCSHLRGNRLVEWLSHV